MNYADVRPQIKSGDLLSWSHRVSPFRSFYDFKVWCVRLFQISEYSHVGIAWVSGSRVWVIESVTPIPRLIPLSGDLPVYHTSTDIGWTPDVEQYALSFIGNEAYQYSQWEAMKGYFGRNDKANKRIECAELVQLIYDRAGLNLTCRATPSDVTRAIQARGGFMTLLEDIK